MVSKQGGYCDSQQIMSEQQVNPSQNTSEFLDLLRGHLGRNSFLFLVDHSDSAPVLVGFNSPQLNGRPIWQTLA